MNNMDLGYEMFCYQCEQTANGKGCTKLGVCGKTPEIANLQDLLIFQIKGISCYGKVLQDEGQHIDKNIIRFIENVLFTTLTNVNFDSKVHVELLNESQRIKENLRTITGELHNQTSYATYDLPETKTQMLKDAQFAGIMYDKSLDPDIRSLRQTILYGLKGISAYGHQARELGYYTEFAKMVPKDCVILTLACGKYRFNKLDFGEVAGLPRLLDVGQCNDVYSAIRIATGLADAFGTDVNGLPLSLIVSWYEQKAVADFLALLSLGIKGTYLGPTLPAFLSPNVLQYLVDTFDLRLITNAEDDIKTCLKQNI